MIFMLIDSNIIIYALNDDSNKQAQAQSFLNQNKNKLYIAHQNIFETLRILTHHKFSHPYPTDKAIANIQSIAQFSTIIHPTSNTQEIAFGLIKKYAISGSEIFDAYLVATALSHQITTIASDNTKHLKKYTEITTTNPLTR